MTGGRTAPAPGTVCVVLGYQFPRSAGPGENHVRGGFVDLWERLATGSGGGWCSPGSRISMRNDRTVVSTNVGRPASRQSGWPSKGSPEPGLNVVPSCTARSRKVGNRRRRGRGRGNQRSTCHTGAMGRRHWAVQGQDYRPAVRHRSARSTPVEPHSSNLCAAYSSTFDICGVTSTFHQEHLDAALARTSAPPKLRL